MLMEECPNLKNNFIRFYLIRNDDVLGSKISNGPENDSLQFCCTLRIKARTERLQEGGRKQGADWITG